MMSEVSTPTVVLVHGGYADASSWNGVIPTLLDAGHAVNAVANPCRGVKSDATYLEDVLASICGPIVLVAHSWAGMIVSQAATANANVKALVYVGAFAPESGESAVQLAGQFPGSTIGESLYRYPLRSGGAETIVAFDQYHDQFVADGPIEVARLMAAGQRPISDAALQEPASSDRQAWKTLPSWFIFGSLDKHIPAAALRFMARRAHAIETIEIEGASHSLAVTHPREVSDTILAATNVLTT